MVLYFIENFFPRTSTTHISIWLVANFPKEMCLQRPAKELIPVHYESAGERVRNKKVFHLFLWVDYYYILQVHLRCVCLRYLRIVLQLHSALGTAERTTFIRARKTSEKKITHTHSKSARERASRRKKTNINRLKYLVSQFKIKINTMYELRCDKNRKSYRT